MKISQQGVGTATHPFAMRDSNGTGLVAVQAEVTGTATYRILGRVSPDAPWRELRPSSTAGFIDGMSLVPYIAVEITAGTGWVTFWVNEA